MQKSVLALLVQAGPDAGLTWTALPPHEEYSVRLQHVERLPMALARIAGGDVDVVLLDVAAGLSPDNVMDSLRQLIQAASPVPVVLTGGAENPALALQAAQAGAAGYLTKAQIGTDLYKLLRSLFELPLSASHAPAVIIPERQTDGCVIALAGVKGGVGTTTIALNIASILARRSTVILVEMRPTFGSLAASVRSPGVTRNLSQLLNSGSQTTGYTEVEGCLWAYKKVPGLSILFGPQTAAECIWIDPEPAKSIVESLSGMAEYVVVELPPSLSKANRAVMEMSRTMALVMERDPISLQAARFMVQAIEAWNAVASPIGVIVVNRAPVSCPMPMHEIDVLPGCQVLGIIPPDPDLCLSAQNAGVPLAAIRPESLLTTESMLTGSLETLAETLAPVRARVPRRSPGGERVRA